jgi:hypothetical protein
MYQYFWHPLLADAGYLRQGGREQFWCGLAFRTSALHLLTLFEPVDRGLAMMAAGTSQALRTWGAVVLDDLP